LFVPIGFEGFCHLLRIDNAAAEESTKTSNPTM